MAVAAEVVPAWVVALWALDGVDVEADDVAADQNGVVYSCRRELIGVAVVVEKDLVYDEVRQGHSH